MASSLQPPLWSSNSNCLLLVIVCSHTLTYLSTLGTLSLQGSAGITDFMKPPVSPLPTPHNYVLVLLQLCVGFQASFFFLMFWVCLYTLWRVEGVTLFFIGVTLVYNIRYISSIQHCISTSVYPTGCSSPKLLFPSVSIQLTPFAHFAVYPTPPALVIAALFSVATCLFMFGLVCSFILGLVFFFNYTYK